MAKSIGTYLCASVLGMLLLADCGGGRTSEAPAFTSEASAYLFLWVGYRHWLFRQNLRWLTAENPQRSELRLRFSPVARLGLAQNPALTPFFGLATGTGFSARTFVG